MKITSVAKEHSFINLFRAIAAFWVLTAHCMIWGGWYGLPLPSAKIAVDLFMLISGYLMAASAISRQEKEPLNKLNSWLRFYNRRFFRIAPAYYVSLILAVLAGEYFLNGYILLQALNPVLWGEGGVYDPSRIEYTPTNILLHISFLFGLHPQWSFSTFLPDWSLSLEMQFYFVFPMLMLLMLRMGYIKIAVLVCAISIPSGLAINQYAHYYEPSLLLFKLQYFIAGILIYSITSTKKRPYSRLAMLFCALGLVSFETQYGKELIVEPAILFSMVWLGWLERKNKTPKILSKLMNSRLVRMASNLSYGVYLTHGFFIAAFGYLVTNQPILLQLTPMERVGVMFIFVTVMAYTAGYMMYRWIEIPGIKLGRFFNKKWLAHGCKA